MTPTDVLQRPAHRFWMDAEIRAAGATWENEQREQAREQQQTSAGTNDTAAKRDLAESQEARAEERENRDGNPGMGDQMDALRDLKNGGDPSGADS